MLFSAPLKGLHAVMDDSVYMYQFLTKVCVLADAVKRKILVLDLDETLIHSHHDGVLRPTVRPGTPPDFILKVRNITYYYIKMYMLDNLIMH